MKYKINEIFYSIQGEGHFVGNPAVFIRFSGCNLNCPWCDTKNHNEGNEYTKEELEKEVERLTDNNKDILIVFTGGEPTLQLQENEELLEGYYRTIETNGLKKVPSWVDWVTCSPKTDNYEVYPDEIKVIYEPHREAFLKKLLSDYCINDVELYLQPLEQDGKMNIEDTIEFIKKNPKYTLSLQIHKLIGVK